MDNKWLEKLEAKLDKQDERIDQIDIHLTEIKVNLKEHMRRSLANEENNKLLQELIQEHKKEADVRITNLEKLKGNIHFLGWALVGVLGVLETLKKLNLF